MATDPKPKVDTDKPIMMDEPVIQEAQLLTKFPGATLDWIRKEFADPESKFNSVQEIIEYIVKEVGIQRHFVVAAVKLVEGEVEAKTRLEEEAAKAAKK